MRGRRNGYVICQVDCHITVTNINPRAIKGNYRGTSFGASPSDITRPHSQMPQRSLLNLSTGSFCLENLVYISKYISLLFMIILPIFFINFVCSVLLICISDVRHCLMIEEVVSCCIVIKKNDISYTLKYYRVYFSLMSRF